MPDTRSFYRPNTTGDDEVIWDPGYRLDAGPTLAVPTQAQDPYGSKRPSLIARCIANRILAVVHERHGQSDLQSPPHQLGSTLHSYDAPQVGVTFSDPLHDVVRRVPSATHSQSERQPTVSSIPPVESQCSQEPAQSERQPSASSIPAVESERSQELAQDSGSDASFEDEPPSPPATTQTHGTQRTPSVESELQRDFRKEVCCFIGRQAWQAECDCGKHQGYS
jgi:hypothetical protein